MEAPVRVRFPLDMTRHSSAPAGSPTIVPGQSLENPVTGERFTFRETAATTGGELLSFDLTLPPGAAVAFPHVHPIQTERFEVLEGRARFLVGLRTRSAGPGDVVDIAPGVLHAFANADDREARLSVEVRPALALEQMLTDVVALAVAGRLNRRGLPRNPFELALLARTYDEVAHAPFLGVRRQRALLAPLVWAARRHVWSRSATGGQAVALARDPVGLS